MKTFLFLLLSLIPTHGKTVDYELTVAEQFWAPGGMKPVRALTLNGGIPGPTLRFRVGDTARIQVHNQLSREETSIHWHGLLVPNAQDGVPYLTTPPIKAGTSHTFEFPLKHPGTYWYHSHTGLQEQRGVYGSIVVEPRGGEPVRADREQVLVLSDWTRENPDNVMRTLMSGSNWYGIRKGNAQSLLGAAKVGALHDWFQRERGRMMPMDVSDVAYDAFLINGQREIDLGGKPGERVRLRIINAAASSYFYLQSATGPMTIVAADGPAVSPVKAKRLLIGMAETYDVIVTIPESGSWEFRATAQDGSGHAAAILGQGEIHEASDPPKPDLYRMDDMLAGALEAMDPDPDEAESDRPVAPYRKLKSPTATSLSTKLPRRTIEMRLTGDMERYVWSINGKTAREDGVIPVKRGEVLRLEFVNDTMMHHPMHLHGHFFRVIDGDDDEHAPLKHTLDVPPMGRRTIEFEANEHGDWLFHCHLLYHMHAGMTRVFSYDDQGPGHVPNLGEMDDDPLYFLIRGSVQSHMSMGMATLMNARNDFMFSWDVGYGHDGGSMMHESTDYELDLTWQRYFNPNFSSFAGYRWTNDEDAGDRFIGGIYYRLPYLVWSELGIDSDGDVRVGMIKTFQLTPRLALFAGTEYDTGSRWQSSVGLDYTLTKNVSLITQYDSQHGFGGGFGFRF